MKTTILPLLMVLLGMALAPCAWAANRTVRVKTTDELRQALRGLRPGSTVLIAPGTYEGGHYIGNAVGTEKAPIAISGADPKKPPLFMGGGGNAFHLVGCSFITLAHIEARGYAVNGINIDDGGTFDTPARNVTVSHVTVRSTGPSGRKMRRDWRGPKARKPRQADHEDALQRPQAQRHRG